MAGSRKDVIYEDDQGNDMVVNLDESNAEATGFGDFTALSIAQRIAIVKEMRKIECVDPASGATRTIPVGKVTDDTWTGVATTILLPLLGPLGTTAALTAFQIVRRIPEVKFSGGRAKDTGLTDGDDT